MTRRRLVTSAVALPLAASAADTPKMNQIFELRKYFLRNTPENQRARLTDFLQKAYIPAFNRAGSKQIGAFDSLIAPEIGRAHV